MNPVTGVGGASSDPDGDGGDDQAGSGGLKQVQASTGGGLGVSTTIVAASTIPATSSAVTTSAAITISAAASTVATTSVGKGSSSGRSSKGKGPASKRYASGAASSSSTTSVGKGSSGSGKGKRSAPKRCAAGSVVSATTVHPVSAGESQELAGLTPSRTTKCCGFHVCTSHWSALRKMEDSFLCAVEERASTFFRSRIQEHSLSRGNFLIAEISGLRDELFSALEVDMSDFVNEHFDKVRDKVVLSYHVVGGEIKKFSNDEADQFRALSFTVMAAKIRECLALMWSSEISWALDRAIAPDHVRATSAARVAAAAARANVAAAVATRTHARAAASIPDTDPDPDRTRARARACARAADRRSRIAAAAYASAAAAASIAASAAPTDPAVARYRAADARCRAASRSRNAARARAADPSIDPDLILPNILSSVAAAASAISTTSAVSAAPATTTHAVAVSAASTTDPNSIYSQAATATSTSTSTATVAVAGSSTSSLLPGSSSIVPPGFADLFGLVVPSELSEVVINLISDICALARSFYPHTVRIPVLNALHKLSDPGRQRAWCLINMKLYETKFVAKCVAGYCAKLLPQFINLLCSVRVWDSSSRCLLPLTGNRLEDFWISLDQAIFRAVGGIFVSKWALTVRLFPLDPGEGLYALCGGDFVDACARSDTSSSSASIFGSITGGMRVQVAPHGGDHVDLFGFEVLLEVRELLDILICEISGLARRTFSSMVRAQVLDAMSRLSTSERHAWLATNVMLYKTGFVARCFAEYVEFCPDFICSLFRVIPGDASGRSLLSLTGNDLRGFYSSLVNVVIRTVEDIFVAERDALVRRFSVPLGHGEESPSAVLCGRDFVSAFDRAGVPALAISGLRKGQVVARRVVPHIAEVASCSSAAGSSSVSVDVLPVSGMAPEVSVVTEESSDDVIFVCERSLLSGESVDMPPPSPLPDKEALVVDVPPLHTTATTTSLETPPLFVMGEEIGLSMVGVVASEVLVVTEGSDGDVIFIDDHSSVSEGELGDGLSSPLSDEHALVVDVSPSEPSVLAIEEVGLSMVGTSSSSALGVLGDVSSPSPSERVAVLTTSASSITSVEVEGSTTVTGRCYPYGLKKSFASRYSADMTSSSGVPSSSGMPSSMPSGSGVSAGLLSSAPVRVGSVLPLAAGTDGGNIGERLAELLNRGLPPSPPPASESTPTEGKASSSSRGSGGGKRKRKKKS
ncbi:hypothetical protein [Candidatus Ichthyocystis sparus]|uniref:hypothetical protein n=1 Tax=Candidatus Ichthyocystis sparus TaxID=1561004 RepID=UPI00159ECE47|nr:hypothetical protein [Candidatus Ichthyocystis sparus]